MPFEQSSHDVFHSRAGVGKNTAAVRPFLAARLARACAWLSNYSERRRQRLDLRTLDDRMLADIGLSRGDVSSETAKWPWQL